jgi:hypothetical protein
MKYTKYPELKSELKQLAKEIREWKRNRKLDKRIELKIPLWQIELKVSQRKYEFRHKHIAYCLLRGRRYEEIELKTNTPPDFKYVDKIREKYEQKTLRASA